MLDDIKKVDAGVSSMPFHSMHTNQKEKVLKAKKNTLTCRRGEGVFQ